MKQRRFLAVVFVGAALLAGCASDEDSSDGAAESPAGQGTPSAPEAGPTTQGAAERQFAGYNGTVTRTGEEGEVDSYPGQVGIHCSGDALCEVAGLDSTSHSVVYAERQGGGKFVINMREADPLSCQDTVPNVLTGTVVLSGETMTLEAQMLPEKATCPSGTAPAADSGQTYLHGLKFTGTLADGEPILD